MTVVGRVVALRRYPVKSMAAEELDGAEVSWHGLAGDRRWAFVRDGQVRSGFPWLTDTGNGPRWRATGPFIPNGPGPTPPRRWYARPPAANST